MEPEDKGGTENKGYVGKSRLYHHNYQKGVLDIVWDIEILLLNGCSNAEWREYNTARSQVVLVASNTFRFLVQTP